MSHSKFCGTESIQLSDLRRTWLDAIRARGVVAEGDFDAFASRALDLLHLKETEIGRLREAVQYKRAEADRLRALKILPWIKPTPWL